MKRDNGRWAKVVTECWPRVARRTRGRPPGPMTTQISQGINSVTQIAKDRKKWRDKRRPIPSSGRERAEMMMTRWLYQNVVLIRPCQPSLTFSFNNSRSVYHHKTCQISSTFLHCSTVLFSFHQCASIYLSTEREKSGARVPAAPTPFRLQIK